MLHYTGPTFRPPYEANSLILQVTAGCSHNDCTFCSMYLETPFAVSPWEEVEADLAEARAYGFLHTRVFLANGNAFCLGYDRLVRVAEMIHAYLPRVESIGAYARVNDVLDKSVDELSHLAELGYRDINIGVESALDDVLSYMSKGYTVEQARECFARLNEAGLRFNVNIVNAAAGPGRIVEHARANAELCNEAKPSLIFVSPLHVDHGSRLEGLVADGDFEECTVRQYVEEEIELLSGLELEDCLFFGNHVSNPVKVFGRLPDDKPFMLEELKFGTVRIPPSVLDSTPPKGFEGALGF